MSDESRAQELLNRYESRYDRQYQRAMNGLRAYRADRKQDEREARRSHKAKNGRSATGEGSDLPENTNES
jgi:hypothetical protein